MPEPPTPRIALLCAQVPREIVEACGLEPWSITGREDAAPDPGLPQNLCPLVRRAATLLRRGAPTPPAGIVLADSCYPLLRLYDHLEAARPPGAVLLLRVPRRRDADAVRFFRAELQRLARSLESLGGRFPNDEVLAGVVERSVARRAAQSACLTARLDGLAPALTPGLLRDLEADAPPPAACDAPETAPGSGRQPRLLLTGSCLVSGDLIRVLDGLGAAVVAVDACGYTRHRGREPALDAGSDPWATLAQTWLSRPPCPRGQDAGSRADDAVSLAARGSIDAVLYLRTACCTPQGYDLARWRHGLRAAGVPFCALETDGAPWDQPRQVTRLGAFLESLPGRRRVVTAAG